MEVNTRSLSREEQGFQLTFNGVSAKSGFHPHRLSRFGRRCSILDLERR